MAQWYYTAGGTQQGPVDEQQLKQMIASGQVAATELAWREGLPNWSPVSQIAELAVAMQVPTPQAYAPPPQAYGQGGAYGQPTAYPQQQPGYAPPAGYQQGYAQNQPIGYGGYAPTGYGGTPVKVPNHMVGAILSTIFCCQLTGIVAIIYAAQVDGKAQKGDVQGARAAASTAMTWIWVGVGAWVLLVIGFFMLGIASEM